VAASAIATDSASIESGGSGLTAWVSGDLNPQWEQPMFYADAEGVSAPLAL